MAHSVNAIKEELEQNFISKSSESSELALKECVDLKSTTVSFLNYIFDLLALHMYTHSYTCEVIDKELRPDQLHTSISHRDHFFPAHIQDFITKSNSVTYKYTLSLRERVATVYLVCVDRDCDCEQVISLIHT